jgi:hypothetical protein
MSNIAYMMHFTVIRYEGLKPNCATPEIVCLHSMDQTKLYALCVCAQTVVTTINKTHMKHLLSVQM